jgi:type IV pilus assembly protein PilA
MKRKGFTLVEIMIVVAIIALLAAISIPSLIRVRMLANESVAASAMKTICSAIQTYSAANNGYAGADLFVLASTVPAYIDSQLGSGLKQGYVFAVNDADATQFWANAIPVAPGISGRRNFYIDEQGVLCTGPNSAAAHADVGDNCPGGMNPVE